jgi:putative sigma-54 modulation protein
MNIKFTARHFRPRQALQAHALDEVRKLGKFYDGIVSANIILSYERATNSVKVAEINLHVYGTILSASVKSDDYAKSIDAAVEKLSQRLTKYKSKLRAKDKTQVRAIHDKV